MQVCGVIFAYQILLLGNIIKSAADQFPTQ